jgi:hypothetical protein
MSAAALPPAQAYQLDADTGAIVQIPSDTSALDKALLDDLEALVDHTASTVLTKLKTFWTAPEVASDRSAYSFAESTQSKVRIMHTWQVIAAPFDAVRAYLSDPANAQTYSPQCTDLKILQRWNEAPARSVVAATIPFNVMLVRDRQLVWYSTERSTATTTTTGASSKQRYVRCARSCKWPGVNVPSGQVRGALHCSGFVVEPAPSNPQQACVLHYVCQADPCGNIPSAVVNQVQTKQLQVPGLIEAAVQSQLKARK